MVKQQGLTDSELDICRFYDENMVRIYEQVWDSYLPAEQHAACGRMLPALSNDSMILDTAAGTGALASLFASDGYRVTCNELSPAMRARLCHRVSKESTLSGRLVVIEPGYPWRDLVSAVGAGTQDVATCLGLALSHCDLEDSDGLCLAVANMAGVLKSGGFLVVDCKRYTPDGHELDAQGKTRERAVSKVPVDGESVELVSVFHVQADRSLVREMTARIAGRRLGWRIQLWPVDEAAIERCAADSGMELFARLPVGSQLPTGDQPTRYPYLVFRKV